MDYKYNDHFVCPHCGARQEEPVQDFCLENKRGSDSTYQTDCYKCDKYFLVTRLDDLNFTVEKK